MEMGICSNNPNTKVITIKNADGSVAGRISISKPNKKKVKRLQYNFKYISSKILMSKTSNSAGKALATARVTVGMLQRKRKSGNFDEKEIELAIIHAKKMERIARKRMKHLKEEENAKQTGSCITDMEESGMSEIKNARNKDTDMRNDELKKLIQELQKLMDQSMGEFADETRLDELADEMIGTVREDVDSNDLERLKKKHRANELREIIEADMKYLKALFNKYEKEKQEASNSVSLQLSGLEMPVQTPEPPIITEGGSIDLSI